MHEPPPLPAAAIVDIDTIKQLDCSRRHDLHRDYEMRSRLALKTVGTDRYAADSSTEVLCCAYAVDHDPAQLWIPGNPVPPEFIEAANNPSWFVTAHGDHFESAIEHHIMAPRFGWPEIPLERHRCTMTVALVLGLPARLSAAANALELAERKDAGGEQLMYLMSKPRRARRGEDPKQVPAIRLLPLPEGFGLTAATGQATDAAKPKPPVEELDDVDTPPAQSQTTDADEFDDKIPF
jgi:hypothetical protein